MNTCKVISKKWFLTLLLVVLVAGCGSNSNNDTAVPSSDKSITAYSLNGVAGAINETAKTIAVTMPNGTNVTALVATFETTGTGVTVGTVAQISGATANNFTSPVEYPITAADSTTATYTVTVTVASSSAKAVTAYSLAGVAGIVNETAKTVAVTMPNGTNVTALIATFSTTGTGVTAGTMAQISGTTANNFTSPVAYTVTAADNTTAIYTVTVTVAQSSAKAVTAYSLAGVAGTINETAKTVAVTMPIGTNVTALIATFSTTGTGVKVGTTVQTSGTTANNFISPVAYKIIAADSTTAIYTVTVTVASDIIAPIVSSTNPAHLAVNVALNKKIVATFNEAMDTATIIAANVSVTGPSGSVSGAVTYVVGSYTATFAPASNLASGATYTALITMGVKDLAGNALAANKIWSFTTGTMLAAGPAPVDLGTAANYVILAKSGISTTGTTAVTGNLGLSPADATYITGFSLIADATNVFSTSSIVTGQVFAADYAVPTPANLTTAVGDMMTAYTDAAGRAPDYTELGAGNIGGMTLSPGTYKWGTGVMIPTDVTLSGSSNDVWIFEIAQDIVMSSGTRINLIGGAQAKNIFWQVFGIVDIGTTAHFEGIALVQTAVTLKTGATVNGRLLAQTAVTLDASAVTQP